jgi:hypothetical protein
VKRNGVRAEVNLGSYFMMLVLWLSRRWIAMAEFIIVGASAGKQARILIKCTRRHLEDKTEILQQTRSPPKPERFSRSSDMSC